MQKLTQNKIILDLGKLNAKQSGLGEYGLKFGETISNRSKEFNEKFNLKFYFFLPKKKVEYLEITLNTLIGNIFLNYLIL